MKKFLKLLLPIILSILILVGIGWYFLDYDKTLTQNILMDLSHYFSNKGEYSISTWLNELAFNHFGNNDEVALEQAKLYIKRGNYTQAEVALHKGIQNNGGIELYILLSNVYVMQDKLLDAAELLDNVSNPDIRQELSAMRPAAPLCTPQVGTFHKYLDASFFSTDGVAYVKEGKEYPSTQSDAFKNPIKLHDGENTFSCITVAENGLVSPLVQYTYTVGGIIEEVTFTDHAMEREIRKLLAVDEDATIYSNDIWQIKQFTVPSDASDYSALKYLPFLEKLTIENGQYQQLSYLEKMPELKSLVIKGTPVTDKELAIIGNLTKLEELTLNDCGITTVASLSKLSNLTILDLGNNNIRNLEPISKMAKLKTLSLARNYSVDDISLLANCKDLLALDLSYNSLTAITPLYTLQNLILLNLQNNAITSVEGITKLNHISELNISYNQIQDITPLADCDSLTKLDISNNQIADIQGLSSLKSITHLNFSYNQVSDLPKFDKTCKLIAIDGSYNKIDSLAPLAGLKSLNNVYMDHNSDISNVNILKDCPVLIQVNVFGTNVHDVYELTQQSIIVNYNPVG